MRQRDDPCARELNAGTLGIFANGASTSRWLTGWTAGTSVEFALSQNWSAKGEWMYFDLGSDRYLVDDSGDGLVDATTRGEAARVGVSYHLGRWLLCA